MGKLSTRFGVAGIGLVLLTAAGCGVEATPRTSDGGSTEDEKAEPVVLVDVSGQQVCDLLSPETREKYVPGGRLANNTVSSTETKKAARCESSGSDPFRNLAVDVQTTIPTTPEGPVAGATPDEYTKEWLADARASAKTLNEQGEVNGITTEPPEDLTGVGDEGFTSFSLDVSGATAVKGYFRSGPFSVLISYHGFDRPNPDDRDNKQYLQKDVLVAAITALGAEIDGNLAALADGSGGSPGQTGELNGDALCEMLSEELVKRYLPEAKDESRTSGPGNGTDGRASCAWSSAVPRPDSPGLRLRSGGVNVMLWGSDAKSFFEDDRETAQQRHDEGPVKEGPRKGVTYTAPQDVPGLGLAAWLQLSHSPPDSPGANASLHVLLPGERVAVISYGGSDEAELDTGTPGQGDLGEPATVPDDEVIGAVMAMAEELLPQLG